MTNITRVILITGFLGAGKTTFLNRIIKQFPDNRKLMIMMNEFGEIGLDGALIEGEDVDILEISKGSIFCVCVKTDFIRALNEIAHTIKPDVLIVESTGVANPSDLKKDLNLSIFKNRFQMGEQICIIDAAFFEDAYETFVSVEKQIASSTKFIINKIDLVSEETIAGIKNIIKQHHPDPQFIETTYSRFSPDTFEIFPIPDSAPGCPAPGKTSSMELEEAINKLLENPDIDATPPDRLLSAVYTWKGNGIDSFKRIIPELPKGLVRAKGFLGSPDTPYLFNLVMNRNTLERYPSQMDKDGLMNQLVFIGPPEAIQALEAINNPNLYKFSILDPMQNRT